jgi:hypothetical protein
LSMIAQAKSLITSAKKPTNAETDKEYLFSEFLRPFRPSSVCLYESSENKLSHENERLAFMKIFYLAVILSLVITSQDA